MQDSKIIEVQGVFLGAAVRVPEGPGWRFVAADPRVQAADGQVMPSLEEARALAKQTLFASMSRAA